jgi:hypothetical protein
VSSSWSTGSKVVCVATTIENPDNGTMASAGGIGASEGDVKVEGDNVMGAPVTRPRLKIDGAVDGELDGEGELNGDCIPLHDFLPGLTRRDSLPHGDGELNRDCIPLLDIFPGATRRDSLVGLLLRRTRRCHAVSFVEPLSLVERYVGT